MPKIVQYNVAVSIQYTNVWQMNTETSSLEQLKVKFFEWRYSFHFVLMWAILCFYFTPVGVRYVLPVLWMTSGFHIMGSWDQSSNGPEASSTKLCLEEFGRWRYQLDVRQLQRLLEFVRLWHRARVKYVIYDCLVSFQMINYLIIAWLGSRDPFNFRDPIIFCWNWRRYRHFKIDVQIDDEY